MDCFKKKINNLYYKKIIYRKKQLKNNSFSTHNIHDNSIQNTKIKISHNKRKQNSLNIKKYQTGKEIDNSYNKSFYSTLNLTNNQKQYKKIIKIHYNLNTVILIQKYVRGFITRKKIKKFKYFKKNNAFIAHTANSKRFQKKININIFDAIKRNSKNQKKSMKLANNRFNDRSTVNNNSNIKYNKSIIFISDKISKNKSYSYDYKNAEENKIKKSQEKDLPNNIKLYNDNNNNDNNHKINNNKNNNKINKRNENQNLLLEAELSLSNFFNEQLPQNINTNIENSSINEKENKNNNNNNKIKNININLEILKNQKRNQTEQNIIQKKKIKSSIFFNKNKKNLILPEFANPSHVSTFQTKENTKSDRNLTMENNNFNLDSPQNNSTRKTAKALENQINDYNKVEEKEKKDNKNNLNTSIDYYLKDEFDSEDNYQKNKKNFNLINTNIKYNFNPMINSKLKSNTNINTNNNNNSNNKNKPNKYNYHFHGTFTNDIDIPNKNKKIFDTIKEEKQTDIENTDLKSLKSSFYDEEEFVIINYDYSLNDKKKDNVLKITNVENINIKGSKNRINEFIKITKNIFTKTINRYVFNLLKKIKKNDDNDTSEKSMTENDSISVVPEGRIKSNNIVFNFAQIEMKNNNKNILSNSNKNIRKYNKGNLTNKGFKEIELIKNNKNYYSP